MNRALKLTVAALIEALKSFDADAEVRVVNDEFLLAQRFTVRADTVYNLTGNNGAAYVGEADPNYCQHCGGREGQPRFGCSNHTVPWEAKRYPMVLIESDGYGVAVGGEDG